MAAKPSIVIGGWSLALIVLGVVFILISMEGAAHQNPASPSEWPTWVFWFGVLYFWAGIVGASGLGVYFLGKGGVKLAKLARRK